MMISLNLCFIENFLFSQILFVLHPCCTQLTSNLGFLYFIQDRKGARYEDRLSKMSDILAASALPCFLSIIQHAQVNLFKINLHK